MKGWVLALVFLIAEPTLCAVGNTQHISATRSLPFSAMLGEQNLLQSIILDDESIQQTPHCGFMNSLLFFLSVFGIIGFTHHTRWYWSKQMILLHLSDRSEMRKICLFWGGLSVAASFMFAFSLGICQRVSTFCSRVHDALVVISIGFLILGFLGSVLNQIDSVDKLAEVLNGKAPLPPKVVEAEQELRQPQLQEYHFRVEQVNKQNLNPNAAPVEQKTDVVQADAVDDDELAMPKIDANSINKLPISSYVRSVLSERFFKDIWSVPLSKFSLGMIIALLFLASTCTSFFPAQITKDKPCDDGTVSIYVPNLQRHECKPMSCPPNALFQSSKCLCLPGFTGDIKWDSTTKSWIGACEECEVGSISTELGGTCTPCEAGKSTKSRGMTECVACETGKWSFGTRGCQWVPCPDQTLARATSGGKSVCWCKAGFSGTVEVTLTNDKYDTPTSACTPCPDGQFSGPVLAKAVTCVTACPSGSYAVGKACKAIAM